MSRYVLGHEAMRKMILSNVLIIGLRGLGVEIGMWPAAGLDRHHVFTRLISEECDPGWCALGDRL